MTNIRKENIMTTFKSVEQAVAVLGAERTLTLVHSALRAQERSREQGKKDRALLKMIKSGEYNMGGTRVDMTVQSQD